MRLLLLVAALACAHSPERVPWPPPAIQPSTRAPAIVTLDRGECFGSCPMYTVVVYADGAVDWLGALYVKEVGQRTKVLSPEQAQQIRKVLQPLAAFDDRIHLCSDSPWVTVQAASVTRRTQLCGQPGEKPLHDLAERLDQLIGTAEWLGKPEERKH